MKYSAMVRKVAAILLALALSFTGIPALAGTMTVNAASNNLDVMYPVGGIAGCCGGFFFQIFADDKDAPNSPVWIDVYLDNTKVFSQATNQYDEVRAYVQSNAYGTHTVKFKVHDINSSGRETGDTMDITGPTITVYTNSDFVESDIKVYSADCTGITGRVPISWNTTMSVSNNRDGGYKHVDLNENGWYASYDFRDDAIQTGVAYAKVTCYDGSTYKTIIKEIDLGEHSYDSGTVATPAKCTADGVKSYTCSTCGRKKIEVIPKIGHHTWNSGTITRPAKYFTAGVKTFKCTVCGAKKTTSIPKKNIAKVKPAKVTIKSAKVKKKKLTLKWKRIAKKTKGYQIGLKDKKSGMTKYYNVKQSSKSTISTTIKKLEKGRKYAIRVRAYNIVEGKKVYGPWSKTKSGKV